MNVEFKMLPDGATEVLLDNGVFQSPVSYFRPGKRAEAASCYRQVVKRMLNREVDVTIDLETLACRVAMEIDTTTIN